LVAAVRKLLKVQHFRYRQYIFPKKVLLLIRWVVQLLLVLVVVVVVERAGCLTTLSTERAHILSTYKQLVTSR
jgi:hypothetical protein